MKYFVLAFLSCFVAVGSLAQILSAAADEQITVDPQPKYEVTISIKYNALWSSQVADLVRDITSRHADACDLEVVVKGLGRDASFGSYLRLDPPEDSPYEMRIDPTDYFRLYDGDKVILFPNN